MLPHLHLCWLNALLIQFPLKKSEVYRAWGTKVKLCFVVSPAMPHVQRMEVDHAGWRY